MLDFLRLTPDTVEMIGQALGIIGMVLIMSSFQFKKLSTLCLLQALGGVAFTFNFILLGDMVSAVMNMFSTLRGLAFGFAPRKTHKYLYVILCLLMIGASVVTYDPEAKALWLTVLITLAQIVNATIIFIGKPKVIRIVQLAVVSPAWMVNNIISFTIGGILCEAFNFISSAISIFRFRKEWFGKKEKAE